VIVHSGTVSSSKEQKLRQLGVYAILEKGTTMNDVVKVAQQLKDTAEANRKENFKQS
jgi:methylmalonyl-CoA mutase cobalamin-binding subunit